MILVGDSLANVILGLDSTRSRHGRPDDSPRGRRATRRLRALVVVDMPFMSYQISTRGSAAERRPHHEGDERAGREGRRWRRVHRGDGARDVARRHSCDGPSRLHAAVGEHARWLPRAGARTGRSGATDRGSAAARGGRRVFRRARSSVPHRRREGRHRSGAIPTIGIGAGAECDGQVLVLHDLLGLNDLFRPKFLRRYAEMAGDVRSAVARFADDVRTGAIRTPSTASSGGRDRDDRGHRVRV